MADLQYDKYVVEGPFVKGKNITEDRRLDISDDSIPGLKNATIHYNCITSPLHMVKKPHTHEHDELLIFIGTNPLNLRDFDAEIEMSMGEEEETYVITKTTTVFVPKGLAHCPLNFKRIDSPIIFMAITLGEKGE